jgi:hypothetical protein
MPKKKPSENLHSAVSVKNERIKYLKEKLKLDENIVGLLVHSQGIIRNTELMKRVDAAMNAG